MVSKSMKHNEEWSSMNCSSFSDQTHTAQMIVYASSRSETQPKKSTYFLA